jgi:methylmalonyl-CoA/ethylmalonyl-CoA epimerase
MLKVKKISHVAMAVSSLDETLGKLQKVLGVIAGPREYVPAQKVDAAILPFGETSLEIVEPRGNEGLTRFLEKRGPSLHHVAIEVEGIDGALAFLKSLGIALIDEAPRIGAHGHKVAFVHPKATGGLLIELVEPVDDHGQSQR